MTTILVCADDLIPEDLEVAGARVVVVDDLCRRLKKVGALVADGERSLMVVVHRNHIDLGSIQAATRRMGFNPLGVGVVDLQTVGAADDLAFTLAAAIARTSLFTRAQPEQIKVLPPDRSSRRSLLSIGKPRYIGAPSVDPSACSSAGGCRACVTQCPTGALSFIRGSIEHDIDACVVCGICVTTCPADAIENPTAKPAAIEAEIRAAIEHAHRPPGVRFRCRGARVPAEAGWYQVEVPCTGMLTPGWVLAPVAMGASGVDVVPCSSGGCQLHNEQRTLTMLNDVATITERLHVSVDASAAPAVVGTEQPGLLEGGASSRLIDLLAPPDENIAVELDAADVGWVSINPQTCTACERCARACPAGAILSSSSGQGADITFDPGRCTACGTCATVCPELERGAIEVHRGFDLADLALGRRSIRREQNASCEICGKAVAPLAMLARIEAMLGDDGAATMPAISARCLDCRGR